MTSPCVGIFWFVSERGRVILLADSTPISEAEPYGECLTHPAGHAEFWDGLGRQGPGPLARQGLPTAPALHEYEEFPRGRVVYWPGQERFVIYADRQVQRQELVEQVVERFSIPRGRFKVESDPHYVSPARTGRKSELQRRFD